MIPSMLQKEPIGSDTSWSVPGEDDLGLCSRYLSQFYLMDANHNLMSPDVRIHAPSVTKSMHLRKHRIHAVGLLVVGDKRKWIKTSAICAWNVEVGITPSAGIWIATEHAWYKLMSPHRSYAKIHAPLASRANVAITMAAVLRTQGMELELNTMQQQLRPYKLDVRWIQDANFLILILEQICSKGRFLQALQQIGDLNF